MKENKLNPGDQVIIIKSGYYDGKAYNVGEIWNFNEYDSDNVIVCSRDKVNYVKLMINGSSRNNECKPYVPEITNSYSIY